MLMPAAALRLLAAAALSAAAAAASDCPNNLKTPYPAPVAKDGWTARVVANEGMQKPRSLLFDTDGALLVLDQNVGVLRLVLDDHGGSCVTVKDSSTLIDNKVLSPDGKTLYASTANDVLAWAYDAGSGAVSGEPRVVVTGMDNAMHKTRTLLLTSGGDLLVSRGSAANADVLAREQESGHCQIRSFDASGERTNYTAGTVVGWGLRNSVGVAEHPGTRGVWSVENSVDNLRRRGVDIHNTNPGEELNFHGTVGNYTGDNFGYPMCYTLWDTDGFPGLGGLRTGDNFAVEIAEEQDVAPRPLTDAQCGADATRPVLALPAHTAPLDVVFDADGAHAYVSLHGSWNAAPPVGYALVRVPFADGRPAAAADAKDGFEHIVTSPDLARCPKECFRPVGLAWDAKKRLFLASDSTREIFVVMPESDEDGGGGGGGGGDGDGDGSAAVPLSPPAPASWLAVAVGALGAYLL